MCLPIRPLLAVLALTAGVSGCATVPTPQAAHLPTAASGEEVRCRIERPTGSNLGAQVCTTKAQRDATKADTQSVQQELGKTQAGPCTAPGCSK